MKNRKTLLAGVAIVGLLISTKAEALIPVFDGSVLAEMVRSVVEMEKAFALQVQSYVLQTKQYIGEYFGWVTQLQQLTTQLEQYYTEGLMLANFVHHPTYGQAMGLMNQAGLGNALPFSPYAVANLINGQSYGTGGFGEINGLLGLLSGLSNASYAQNRIYAPTDGSWASQQLNATANSLAGAQGAELAAYDGFRNHMGVLPAMRQSAASADTVKDALDAGNMLQAETAWNLNQLGQANMIAYYAAQQRDVRVQRDEERLACELEMFRNGGGACPTGNNGAMAGGGGGASGGSDTMIVPPVPPLVGVGAANQPMTPPAPVPPAQPYQPPPFDMPPPAPNTTPPSQPPLQVGGG